MRDVLFRSKSNDGEIVLYEPVEIVDDLEQDTERGSSDFSLAGR